MPFFSIIVPVYNVDTYLRECIESILSQSFNDYEMLLIDDGSTDNSGKICDEYGLSNRDKVRVIHKENGGLSDTRNVGISKAEGKYILFVDSDDYIAPQSLNIFYEKLCKCKFVDVLITRFMQVYSNAPVKNMDAEMPVGILNGGSKEKVIAWIFQKSQNTWPAQRYIVNGDFIRRNQLLFKKGFLHEDIDWTAKLFFYAEQFACIDYYWYAHRIGRMGSITTKPRVKRILDIIEIVNLNVNDPRYETLEATSKKIVFNRLVASLYSSISLYKIFDQDEKRKIENALKQTSRILKYSQLTRHRIFWLFSNVFGFKLGLRIMSYFN